MRSERDVFDAAASGDWPVPAALRRERRPSKANKVEWPGDDPYWRSGEVLAQHALRLPGSECWDGQPFDQAEFERRACRLSPADPGWCYLALVRQDARVMAATELGINPTGLALAAWLEVNTSVWTAGVFRVTIGVPRISKDGGYVQWHIEASESGVDHRGFLRLSLGGSRVGAETQTPGRGEAASSGPSRRELPVGEAGTRVRLPFMAKLTHLLPRAAFSPRTSTSVQGLTKYFESAQVADIRLSVSIAGGDQIVVAVGVGTGAVTPSSIDNFLALPLASVFTGKSDGLGSAEFSLPPDHGFGREVKALAVGNADPVLHIFVDGGPATVLVRGYVDLVLRGHGVPAPFQLAAAAAPRNAGPSA